MIEITVADIRTDDIGRRVVVIHDGGTIEGDLVSAWTTWSKYAKPEPGPRTRIEVAHGNAELELKELPGDFLLQIDRSADD